MPGIQTETLGFDAGGAPFSSRYGDVYASRHGALGQARHVFLGGNGLPGRWAGLAQFVILETGFGLGINFLATWQAWREDPRRPRRLHFVSVEKHPLAAVDLVRCAPAPLSDLAAELARAWPLALSGLHRLDFESGAVTLTLGLGDGRALIADLTLGADAFFLDGFAPDRNPEMWDPLLLKAVARTARPGATLATWTTAQAVRAGLSASGFEVDLREGFGAKRQMLTARYAPRFRTRRHEPASPYLGAHDAVVVGAGLAGCACALALARRGWQVTILDQERRAAGAASGLPAGLLYPALSADDNHAARMSRAGFLHGRRLLDRLHWEEPLVRASGVLKLAPDGIDEPRWLEALERQHWPGAFVRGVGMSDAAQAAGVAPRRGGLWFGDGAVVSAAAWCRAMLRSQPAIELHTRRQAVGLAQAEGAWSVQDQHGRAQPAAAVVVASAMDAARLLGSNFSPVHPVRGRTSRLAEGTLVRLRAGIAGQGYVLPDFDGRVAVGATYEPVGAEHGPGLSDARAQQSNLDRLALLLDQAPAAPAECGFDALRCVARDRTPFAGAVADEAAALAAHARLNGAQLADLPRRPGLFCVFALGSRGLSLAPLLGELVAAQIEGEPLPVERALAASVDPARFLLRHLRRTR